MKQKKSNTSNPYAGISYFPDARDGHHYGVISGKRIHSAPSLEEAIKIRSGLPNAVEQEEAEGHTLWMK